MAASAPRPTSSRRDLPDGLGSPGGLTATAAGGIFVTETGGDLRVRKVTSSQSNQAGPADVVLVSALGSILGMNAVGIITPNVVGDRIDLGAFGGGVGGGSGAPLYLDSGTSGAGSGQLFVYAKGSIYAAETDGELRVLGASSRDGLVELTVLDSGPARAPADQRRSDPAADGDRDPRAGPAPRGRSVDGAPPR